MSRLLLIVLVCITGLVCACSNKDNAPSGIIPKEKMESVLWDMIQAERFTASFMATDTAKNVKLENFKLYSQIFELHQISKEDFIKSYKFYLSRPDIARVMFDSLSVRSNREREELFKPKPVDSTKTAQPPAKPNQPVKDSLAFKKQKPGIAPTKPIIPDTLKRRLRTGNRLLRPVLRNRDSVLRKSQ